MRTQQRYDSIQIALRMIFCSVGRSFVATKEAVTIASLNDILPIRCRLEAQKRACSLQTPTGCTRLQKISFGSHPTKEGKANKKR